MKSKIKVVTQKSIRELIGLPGVIDLGAVYTMSHKPFAIPEATDTVSVSRGIYGLTGFVKRGKDSGTLYVCANRSSAMFYYL